MRPHYPRTAHNRQALRARSTTRSTVRGFTLLELTVVISVIGVLFAIAAPGWLTLLSRQQLNTAQSEVYQAMRAAQEKATQQHLTWEMGVREREGVVQWAVYPANAVPPDPLWKSLDPNIRLDAETTLQSFNSLRRVQFNYRGHVNGQLGRLTLSSKAGGTAKRCVLVSTLLGAIRTGSEHSTAVDGKRCY